jgi:hypothetical protein
MAPSFAKSAVQVLRAVKNAQNLNSLAHGSIEDKKWLESSYAKYPHSRVSKHYGVFGELYILSLVVGKSLLRQGSNKSI